MSIRKFQKGDTIHCNTKEELVDLMLEFESCGYDTDFLYEKDGEKGLWLEIKGVKKSHEQRD